MSSDRKQCRARFPKPGPYSPPPWQCERSRWHAGRHRFRNYTRSRVPHVWQVPQLWRTWKANRRLMSYRLPGEGKPGLLGYRSVLFPKRFDPVPVVGLNRSEKREPLLRPLLITFTVALLAAAIVAQVFVWSMQ